MSLTGSLADLSVEEILQLAALTRLRDNPPKPYVAVLGGAKVSDKIGVIDALMTRVDGLVIGGAMANTFLAAQGFQVGKSLVELDQRETARQIISPKVVLPRDLVVAQELAPNARSRITVPGNVDQYDMILDVGPRTISEFARRIEAFCGIEPGSMLTMHGLGDLTIKSEWAKSQLSNTGSTLDDDKFWCLMNALSASNLEERGVRFGFIGNEAYSTEEPQK